MTMTTQRAPDAPREDLTRMCSVQGCARRHLARGMCSNHYQRAYKKGELAALPTRRCSVDGCQRRHSSRGFCALHYRRWWSVGEVGPIGTKRKADGEGSLHSSGYVIVWRDGKQVPQHHIVMEQVLGRRLASHENVHHRNGIRHDNRPENLELWTRPQPAGQRPADLAAWVVEFYPELVVSAAARQKDSA